LALCATLLPAAALADEPAPAAAFPVRVIKAGGALDAAAVQSHLDFALEIGFNGIWVDGAHAGSWSGEEPPALDPAFVTLAAECRSRGTRLIVTIHPVAEASEAFAFSDPAARKRLRRFIRLLRNKSGVQDVVLSFHGASPRLSELLDVLEFGIYAAPAHVDLVRDVARDLDDSWRLWMQPTIGSDLHLDDPRVQYGAWMIGGLAELDPRVGLVWNGPAPLAEGIDASQLAATRERFGGRELILEDRFPFHGIDDRLALALVLAPLKRRDPDLATQIAMYVATPMTDLGASRLSLLTVADFLREGKRYDWEASWQRAIDRLAGEEPRPREALKTQALEWGGFVGERNYRTVRNESPREVAARLLDPAYVSSWKWTVTRYPGRIEALADGGDEIFREELLRVMRRRLAIGRALRPTRELRARRRVGRTDLDDLLEQLRHERDLARAEPTALLALDRFLVAAGVGDLVLKAPAGSDQR
jgi:hypothetical protein